MFKRLLPFAAIFLFIQTLLRVSLIARGFFDVEFSPSDMAQVLVKGVWFDVVTCSFLMLPFALYCLVVPARLHGVWAERVMRFAFCFVLLFDAVAEHLFWTEFTTRFNFIAVDYLIYTQEVIGNIKESYPVGWLVLAVALFALLLCWLSLRLLPFRREVEGVKRRAVHFVAACAACGVLYSASNMEQAAFANNAEAGELAANGIYNLFNAFWHNEIRYDRFYTVEAKDVVRRDLRNLMFEKAEESEFIATDGKDEFTRVIKTSGPERHKNVVLVVMESMSADYMQRFGNTENLTPVLDRLTKESLFLSNTYATGTRTVRGLEAVTLSIPPTPGQSIIRRPGNENLFSLGFIFKDRGYDAKFIYGGYGYFDNMNAFFAGNGFDVVDRTSMDKKKIDFANVWGVCDEDMFTRALEEGDASYAAGKPFFHLIMTTSNHRPFTYPDGRIDLPSHGGRSGGVKYADYAVGKLLEDAKKKPWFKDTVFVFVSDHTAGAGGKAELDPHKYHIPMMFYSPGFIKPREFSNIASQIDMAPILLGLLNFSYYTKFYGEDLLRDTDEVPHAFISNYQKVALVKENELTVLAPKRKVERYRWPEMTPLPAEASAGVEDAVAYYQSASWWREFYGRIPTVVK